MDSGETFSFDSNEEHLTTIVIMASSCISFHVSVFNHNLLLAQLYIYLMFAWLRSRTDSENKWDVVPKICSGSA